MADERGGGCLRGGRLTADGGGGEDEGGRTRGRSQACQQATDTYGMKKEFEHMHFRHYFLSKRRNK